MAAAPPEAVAAEPVQGAPAEANAAAAEPSADAPAGESTVTPAMMQELLKAQEPQQELEEDAEEDKRAKLEGQVVFLPTDTTLNLLPSVHGNVLMSLTDGGLQYFLAGARANVGMKDGRYMFEVKIVEILNPAESRGQHGRTWTPRQLLRIGVSTARSTLFLGETEDSVCYDSEGTYTYNKVQVMVAQKFAREQVIAVVLNLDEDSPNAHTISLFRDGKREGPPQKLPDNLKGKPLFPTVTFRNLTVHVNFSEPPMANMPFRCRMIGDAAEKDVLVTTQSKPRDGKYEVLFPVCLPDQGTFDWLDLFLDKNPEYTELSDRKLLEWAEKSGIFRPKGYGWKTSNDKPDMNFGIPQLDDLSARAMLQTIATAQQRNLVVMEVKSNLMKEERKEALIRFNMPHFKKVAQIMVGEPTKDYKERVASLMLKEKQEAADAEFKQKQAEDQRKRLILKREKEIRREQKLLERAAKRQRKAEEEAFKQANEAKPPIEQAENQNGDAKKDEDGETKPDEKKGEGDSAMAVDKKDDDDDEDDDKEDDDKMDEDEKPPVVQLTDEEKKQWFRKIPISDMTAWALSTSFTEFTIPVKEEGFDDVRHEWFKKSKCSDYIKEWIVNKKLTTRVEDIQPSEAFNLQWFAWQQQMQKWRQKQDEWKDQIKKAAQGADRKTNGDAGTADENMDEKKAEDQGKVDGVDNVKEDEKKSAPEKENCELEADDFDVFGVTDVCDIGNAEPLFAHFTFEDWALMSLRFELHALVHAFQHDVNDPERAGIHVDHLLFYYNKYFRKNLTAKYYGVESYEELTGLISDSVCINPKTKVLETHLSDDLDSFDIFPKLTEEGRRERHLLIDSGDESAVLKFSHAALTAPMPVTMGVGASMGSALAAVGQPRPYQRGPRAPVPGRGYGGPPGQGPMQQQKQWYSPQGSATGYGYGSSSYSGGKSAAMSGGGKGGGSYGYGGGSSYAGSSSGSAYAGGGYGGPPAQQYGQRRPYYNKGGYGR